MALRLGVTSLLEDHVQLIAGRRVGLVTNSRAVNESGQAVHRAFLRAGVNVTAFFSPEHGFQGEAPDGQSVSSATDPQSGIVIHSLYGETRKPSPAMLENVDVLVYDLPSMGIRFYTYLATLGLILDAASEAKKPVIILDRPVIINGSDVEGGPMEKGFESFVGPYPLPVRYGLTSGEFAGLYVSEKDLDIDLTVIRMKDYRRTVYLDQTPVPFVPPSPNIKTLEAAILYPGTCFMEGTTLSEGRGTSAPFQLLGGPDVPAAAVVKAIQAVRLRGVAFEEANFVPTTSKHAGRPCTGIRVRVIDRSLLRPVYTGLAVLKAFHDEVKTFSWLRPSHERRDHPFIDLLTGSDLVRLEIEKGTPVDLIMHKWETGLSDFFRRRAEVLIYP